MHMTEYPFMSEDWKPHSDREFSAIRHLARGRDADPGRDHASVANRHQTDGSGSAGEVPDENFDRHEMPRTRFAVSLAEPDGNRAARSKTERRHRDLRWALVSCGTIGERR
jgi:hypothetical protein